MPGLSWIYTTNIIIVRGRYLMKKENMKRVVTMCIIVSMILSAFSGCNENSDKSSKANITSESDILELTDFITEENIEENAQVASSDNNEFIIGETITFGKYEQDNDTANGAEPIEWTITDIQDNRVLLISNYILDNIRYNEYAGIYGDSETENRPWASSDIYSWLNNDFASEAFNEEELNAIIDTTDNSSAEAEIIGSVFLLSYQEAFKYLEFDTATDTRWNGNEYELCFSDKAFCQPTQYAIAKGVENEEFTQDDFDRITALGFNCDSSAVGKTFADYWFRSSFNWDSWFTAEGHAMCVDTDGSLSIESVGFNNVKTAANGIRPCIWITSEIETQPITDTETQATTEAIKAEGVYGNAELIDLSFLSSNPNKIELITRNYNVVKRDTGQVELFEADIDIIDTGVSYLLGTSKIKYNLGVSQKAYNDFINNAVDFDGEVQKGNRGGKDLYQYDLIDGSCEFKCYNETFDLIRYYLDDNGRSTAEFVGKDGEYYYIYNDISPCLDDFTEELCYNIKTLSSEDAYREITYNENSYIEISYDMGEQLGIDTYLTKSPDFNSGNPGGMYYLDIDDNGNFAKIVNPFV